MVLYYRSVIECVIQNFAEKIEASSGEEEETQMQIGKQFFFTLYLLLSGAQWSVVECLTQDQGAAGSSLTGVSALWSLGKTHLS